jgi:hypothetical protein
MTIQPGCQISGNVCVIWSDESSFTLFPTSGTVYVLRIPKEAYDQESKSETRGMFCDDLDSNIMVQCFVGPIITLHGQLTAREYVDRLGNQVHPMIQLSKMTMPPFTQQELFNHGLKSIKANFKIFPGQHNHQI